MAFSIRRLIHLTVLVLFCMFEGFEMPSARHLDPVLILLRRTAVKSKSSQRISTGSMRCTTGIEWLSLLSLFFQKC